MHPSLVHLSLVHLGAWCHRPLAVGVRSAIVTNLPMPTFIPVEVCTAVGLPMSTQLDSCMAKVKADVAADGVAAPPANVPGLQKVVANARDRGIDLKVVVMEKSPIIDTPLRDIATQVGMASPGSTVLVISPGWAGSYSTTYDRVLLEAGQDLVKLTTDPVQGAQDFVTQLQTPIFPWTGFTVFLVAAVAAAAAVTRLAQRVARVPNKSAGPAKMTSEQAG